MAPQVAQQRRDGDQAGDRRGTCPTTSSARVRPDAAPRRAAPRSFHSPAPAMIGRTHQEREPSRRLARQPEDQPRRDGHPRAADAGEQRQCLRGADADRVPDPHVVEVPVAPPHDLGGPEEPRTHARSSAMASSRSRKNESMKPSRATPTSAAGTTVSASSHAKRRSGSSRSERSRIDARNGHEQPPQVAPEVDQQRDERAQVEHHVERGGVQERIRASRAAAARR